MINFIANLIRLAVIWVVSFVAVILGIIYFVAFDFMSLNFSKIFLWIIVGVLFVVSMCMKK